MQGQNGSSLGLPHPRWPPVRRARSMAVSVWEGVRWEAPDEEEEEEEEEEQEEEEGESGTAPLLLDAAAAAGRPRFLPMVSYVCVRVGCARGDN